MRTPEWSIEPRPAPFEEFAQLKDPANGLQRRRVAVSGHDAGVLIFDLGSGPRRSASSTIQIDCRISRGSKPAMTIGLLVVARR